MTDRVGPRIALALLLAATLLVGLEPASPGAARAARPTPARSAVAPAPPGSPLLFVENAGQFAPEARFQAPGAAGAALWLAADGLWLTIPAPPAAAAEPRRGINLRLGFVDANDHPVLEPMGRLATRVSYLLGPDLTRWRPDVPAWSGVRYRDLYPGLDLMVGGQDGQWQWRWEVTDAAGRAALARARLRVEGAEPVALADGRARLATAIGDVTLPLPAVEPDGGPSAGAAAALDGREVVAPARAPGAAVAAPDLAAAATDDLIYGTYLGSGGRDVTWDLSLAIDGSGAAYVATDTESAGFPTTPGAYDRTFGGGSWDVVVAKLDPSGGLVYSTYLGGGSFDIAHGLAVDAGGTAYVTGETLSSDFPTTPGAYDRAHTVGEAFVARLNAAGTGLLYSTFLGGGGLDAILAIAVDGGGAAYVAGVTESADFPTTAGAPDRSFNGGELDAFVAKLNAAGSGLVYGAYLGGGGDELAWELAIDAGGAAYVAGQTASPDFPTTAGAFDRSFGGGANDGFVAKLDPAVGGAAGLRYSTFLGGGGDDIARAVAVDGAGAAYVAGGSASADFPTSAGAYDRSLDGPGTDAFVVKLNGAGAGLLYGTYLGGDGGGEDAAYAIVVDEGGIAYVAGETGSAAFPTTDDAYDRQLAGGDAFVTKLDPAAGGAAGLRYSTFLGGESSETAYALAVDADGDAYVAGETWSVSFPTTAGAHDRSNAGGPDAFVAKLGLAVPCPTPPSDGPLPTVWYFAEGYTGQGFDEYLTILNPNPSVAQVTLTYYLSDGTTHVKTVVVPANSRYTVAVHETAEGVGLGKEVSAKVTTTHPGGIVVERPMYFTYTGATISNVTGGHNVMGANAPAPAWYFAEGYTGQGFDQYLTIMNPNDSPAAVALTYFLSDGSIVEKNLSTPANSRYTVVVHETAEGVGRGKQVSTRVTTTHPGGIVVERPMYFRYTGATISNVTGGHNVMGANAPREVWFMAEGYTGAGFDEYLTIMNSNPSAAQVALTYYLSDGTVHIKTVVVPANSRYTVAVHEAAEGVGRGKEVSTKVTTIHPGGIVVERPMYFTYNTTVTGGHNVMGAGAPRPSWYLAEGYTAQGFDEYLTIMNPSSTPAAVILSYYLSDGATPTKCRTIGANSRYTVAVHGVAAGVGRGTAASVKVATTNAGGIVVERPMYFTYNTTVTGGHNVMGYAP